MKLATLNLNHRTHAKAIPPPLVAAMLALDADVLVLTEYVHATGRQAFVQALADGDLEHHAVSPGLNYAKGRWQNQVLIASRHELTEVAQPRSSPGLCGSTNLLTVGVAGLTLTGVRAPAYRGREWYAYWEWLTDVVDSDVVIGDLNVDPRRTGKHDRVLATILERGDYKLAEPDGDWSYRGTNGSTARLDHVLTRSVELLSPAYVAEPFARFTDHAALVADVRPGPNTERR